MARTADSNSCALGPREPAPPQQPTSLRAAHQVDFNVKNDYEYVGNYKELQQALTKTGIKKVRWWGRG